MIDDHEIVARVPPLLAAVFSTCNGFILHSGALHVRGASSQPNWHSLRYRWEGENSLSSLYGSLRSSDIPFAEDQLGDQYLLRDGRVICLDAETGELTDKEASLELFFDHVGSNPAGYLNISLQYPIAPGQLLFAYPPFCVNSGKHSNLKACPTDEVIGLHADFARQIRSVPDGQAIQIVWPAN